MFVSVRHLSNELIRKLNSLEESEIVEFAKNELKHNNYISVCDMSLKLDDIDECLDVAFKLTNSIEYEWTKNPHLDIYDDFKNDCRSTTIGDIIQIKGNSYLVSTYGFIEL